MYDNALHVLTAKTNHKENIAKVTSLHHSGKKGENYGLQISQEVRDDLESKGKDKAKARGSEEGEGGDSRGMKG